MGRLNSQPKKIGNQKCRSAQLRITSKPTGWTPHHAKRSRRLCTTANAIAPNTVALTLVGLGCKPASIISIERRHGTCA